MKRKDKDIYEEFIRMCPYVKDDIRSWFTNEHSELIAELYDGCAYRYDYITKSFKWSESIDEFLNGPENEHEWRKRFARSLYKKMLLKGVNQETLAWKTGIPQPTLSKYISGRNTPTVYRLHKIAEILDCTVDDLISF